MSEQRPPLAAAAIAPARILNPFGPGEGAAGKKTEGEEMAEARPPAAGSRRGYRTRPARIYGRCAPPLSGIGRAGRMG